VSTYRQPALKPGWAGLQPIKKKSAHTAQTI
jgi:hypothetical protein